MEPETSEHPTSAAGRINQALANAVVRAHRDVVGRGPTKAQAFYHHDLVVVLLRGALTTVERSLITEDRADAVLRLRYEIETIMRPPLVEVVESLTGSNVLAAMSTSHLEPELTAELFLLDRPVVPRYTGPVPT